MKFRKDQLALFMYWMLERQSIYLKRKAGEKWPWTKDKILREYKFTNVFRQLDRVTQEWTRRYVTLLGEQKKLSDGDLLFYCAMFRLFNWPETYDCLRFNMARWDKDKAIALLTQRMNEDHEQIFTGAYIIPNAGRTDPKIQVICEALDTLYTVRDKYAKLIRTGGRIRLGPSDGTLHKFPGRSMERAVELLRTIPTIGGFIGYEIACDLRHTRLLSDAKDVNSWANPGPGAMRGIHRLITGARHKTNPRPDYNRCMRELLQLVHRGVGGGAVTAATSVPGRATKPAKTAAKRSGVGRGNSKADRRADQEGSYSSLVRAEWPFEMREIEHSLCEFDKYMRVKNGEGRPRSRYRPPAPKQLDLLED